jgi:hypothetical protein
MALRHQTEIKNAGRAGQVKQDLQAIQIVGRLGSEQAIPEYVDPGKRPQSPRPSSTAESTS